MDYERIYRDFISNRREIEGSLEGYVEVHHILPRSLGGSNDPRNLIRLAPEDHFFAHLLLAKIHGGKMWSPVAFMVGGHRRKYTPIKSRKAYGWAVSALSKSKKREGSYNFDRREHRLINKDGGKWVGRQIDMVDIGINRASACRLVSGKSNITHNGWYLDNGQPVPRQGELHPRAKAEVFSFVSSAGETFTGTRVEFHDRTGIARSNISRLITGEFVSTKGWTLLGRTPPVVGRASRVWAY